MLNILKDRLAASVRTTFSTDQTALRTSDKSVLRLAAAAGVLLLVIGLRFIVWPTSAARTFGVPDLPTDVTLHQVVGFRDLWLGALLVGLCWYRQWRALSLWFGLATLVCLADATIVAQTTGKSLQLTFHVASAMVCTALARATWHRAEHS
ncbi:MAG: DUF4267 domain-containing protein [Hyphomicrobiaceae bacterium]